MAARPAAAEQAALRVHNLGMTFPGTRALDGVDLEVRHGEIHALLGHNGSGKSTLIKVLCGQYVPDQGSSVEIDGSDLTFGSPSTAERLGLRVVHQNLGLVHGLSVTENIAMGAGYGRRGLGAISWRKENALAAQQMARLGYDLNPVTQVGDLSASTRSAVAIARALMPRAERPQPHLLLLDEVSATMPEPEIRRLLELVRSLSSQGVGVIYVSHHLDEALQVAERVTVLRDGKRIESAHSSTLTSESLADLVAGSSTWREHAPTREVASAAVHVDGSSCALTVTKLSGTVLTDLSFDAGPGRIVGIAGITGSGRDEVARLLHGGLPRAGTVSLGGHTVVPFSPRASVGAGLTLVPADRLASAVVATQSVRENMGLTSVRLRPQLTPINRRAERRSVNGWISKLNIRGASVDGSINTLSGGNQQKVMLARCLTVAPRALILDEPTQGVDIGAVAEIHALIRELSSRSTVVVCSSDSYELASLCTEVIVLYRGRKVGHLHGDDVTEENLDRLQLSVPTSPRPTDEMATSRGTA